MTPFSDPVELLNSTLLVDRFVEYVKIDTTSDPRNSSFPSTPGQKTLGNLLVRQLRELGADSPQMDENGYVTAQIPGNGEETVGLIAHLDTSNAVSGSNVQPILHRDYDGRPIHLKNGVTIHPDGDPILRNCIGHTIITSDGTTLLGADDKAGIAVIMSAAEMLLRTPSIPRPPVRICFTPDEEIGRGHERFPLEQFGADVAFTIDGSHPGEMNIETFEAASAMVTFTGISIHPGKGKGQLVNALRQMSRFVDRLPMEKSPERTEQREGFIHPVEFRGDAAQCQCHLLLRAFEEQELSELETIVRNLGDTLKMETPGLDIKTTVDFSYPNMYKYLKKKPDIATRLRRAIELSGLVPDIVAVRGGTDGANLSRKGLPTPNLFAGGINFHGPSEWVSTRNMAYSLCTVLNLLSLYATNEIK